MINLDEHELDFIRILLKQYIEDESITDINEMTFLVEMFNKIEKKWFEIRTVEKNEKNKAKLN
jgi:hypothetical protein